VKHYKVMAQALAAGNASFFMYKHCNDETEAIVEFMERYGHRVAVSPDSSVMIEVHEFLSDRVIAGRYEVHVDISQKVARVVSAMLWCSVTTRTKSIDPVA